MCDCLLLVIHVARYWMGVKIAMETKTWQKRGYPSDWVNAAWNSYSAPEMEKLPGTPLSVEVAESFRITVLEASGEYKSQLE